MSRNTSISTHNAVLLPAGGDFAGQQKQRSVRVIDQSELIDPCAALRNRERTLAPYSIVIRPRRHQARRLTRLRYGHLPGAEFGFTSGEFCELLEEVAARALGGRASAQERARLLETLRLDDLLLARGCARGHEAAWQQFLILYRDKLHLAAAAITREESVAREIADSLYADLFGMRLDGAGERVSKFTSYLGRGSLEGWLRTVLAQEYVNRLRRQQRLVRFEETIAVDAKATFFPDPKLHDIQLAAASDAVLGALSAEERFLLASYYLDGRALAEIGRILNLHESTVSRHLEKITLNLRKRIIARLRAGGLSKRAAEESLEGMSATAWRKKGHRETFFRREIGETRTRVMTKFASFLWPRLEAQQKQTGHHPDANLLLAFAEGALSGRERAVMLTHVAECPECREVLSLSAATGAPETPQRVFSKSSPTWWGWRLAATAAVICFVTITVWRLPFFRTIPTLPHVKPVLSSPRPVPLPPVPLAPKAVQTEAAKPKARAKHEPATPKPEALTVMRPQSGIVASPATSPDLLEPKSMFSTARDAAAQNARQASSNSSNILWSLETSPAAGTVGKSEDGGRTWRTIAVDQGTRFYALSASGADVWVGGAGGNCFIRLTKASIGRRFR